MSTIISKSSLRKISSRVRKGERRPSDIILIESYRDSKLKALYELLVQLNTILVKKGIPFLITGRSKRIKSIIRKLERSKANISSMVDIVGIRIIVDSIESQNIIIECLSKNFDLQERDYRDRDVGYRAVHLYIVHENENIEIQIRSLPQQLWAIESESLGEQVKEGGGTQDQKKYLKELTRACIDLDRGLQISSELSGIGLYRGVLLGKYPNLVECFADAQGDGDGEFYYYLIIFDCRTNELLREDRYLVNEANEAIDEFCRYTKQLKQDDYDVLFLNSTKLKSLRVTHPYYFPI